MGPQGYFYYLHLMTKALTAARVDTLETTSATGSKTSAPVTVDWRAEVASRLLTLQQPDGSWTNQNPRWWETDRNLVTAYVVLTLSMLHHAAPPA